MATRRLRVLMAEKRLSEAGITLRSICAEGGRALEMIFVETREEVGAALSAHRPDLALLDLSLLQPEAALYVHVLHLENSQVPLIIFAEPGDEAFVDECLSEGARDYLLEGFMDEKTVARVLQGVVDGMEGGTLMSSRACLKAGEMCSCLMQAEAPEGTASQSVRRTNEEMQRKLVGVLKQNVRAGDRIVPRWCGRIELVLSNANESCLGTVVRRLRTQMSASQGGLSPETSSRTTVCVGNGVMVSRPLNSGRERAGSCEAGPGELQLEIGERQ